MKKLLAILALVAVGAVNAAPSATVEYQNINNATSANQDGILLSVKNDLASNLVGDATFTNVQTAGTGSLSTRLEAGLTATAPIYGSIGGYVRTALGEKYSNTTRFTFYSVEPGITAPLGPFTAKVGFRYRSAIDDKDGDKTHTTRTTLSYPLTKVDTIAVRYDRVTGANDQKTWVASYTRGF